MYKDELETFIIVAETKSFTKASEILFISSTAIMKQMNKLENDLNMKLLARTNHGISLTKEGEKIYKEAKYIIEYSNKIINSIQKERKKEYIINIGTSLTCSCKPMMILWSKKAKDHPEFKTKIISFDKNHTQTLLTLKSEETKLDFIVSACDSKNWLKKVNFYKLGETSYSIAVPINHKLANKNLITFHDLNKESVMTITEGDSPISNKLYQAIKENCPNTTIINCPFFYDIDVFNTAYENGYLLVTLNTWKDIHPAFKTIPLDFKDKISYGIIYAKKPNNKIKEFLNIITEKKGN